MDMVSVVVLDALPQRGVNTMLGLTKETTSVECEPAMVKS